MRPILLSIPSKLAFAAALILAAAFFFLELARRRRDPTIPRSSTPLYLLAGAYLILVTRGGQWIPNPGSLSHAWKAIPIYSYGVMLGTAMVVGWFLAMRFAKNDGIPPEQAGAIYMWTAIWSIVGARALYVITNPGEFVDSPLRAVKMWEGGLVAYGGMIGGFLASWYGCRKRGIALLRWADAAAPSVVLGTAITRIGCLLFGCDYGKPTDLPWAIRFPQGRPAWHEHVESGMLARDAAQSLPVHPTQLYELLVGVTLFALLMYLRHVRRFSGQVFLGWVIGYGILRPIIELYRDDDERGGVGVLSTSQIIGIVTVALGIALLVHLMKRYRRDPEALRLWEKPLPAAVPEGGAAAQGREKRRKRR